MGQSAPDLLINLVMILLRTRLARWFHFTRPSLSAIKSLADLEATMQERLLTSLKNINNNTLKHYALQGQIQAQLQIPEAQAVHVSRCSIPMSVINPSTLEHTIVDVRLDKGLTPLNIQSQNFGFPFASEQISLTHFSKTRGIPVFQELQQYELDDKTLLIFNLPENITKNDLQVLLQEKPQSIVFKYCVLGLPAYAQITFKNQESLKIARNRTKDSTLEIGERSSKVRGAENLEKLKLANRRLVVHLEPDAELPKMLVEFSRFGRVMHIDWPIEASINPSLGDVKEFYKNRTQLIQINKHSSDGTVDTEYYPNLEVWKIDEDEREEGNILERAEKLQEAYQNRCRFAKPVDVFLGKQKELSLKNRGYCVVTFSTTEECQNYYFVYGAQTKMELVGDKLDFEYDPQFRKELLRTIDNQYLLGVKNKVASEDRSKVKYKNITGDETDQSNKEPQDDRNYETYNLLERIRYNIYLHKGLTLNQNYKQRQLENNNPFLEWEERQRYFKKIKEDTQHKTFDELAEIQLFGRVLPKEGQVEKLRLENTKYTVSREKELVEENNLNMDLAAVRKTQKKYLQLFERNNRLAEENLKRHEEESHEEKEPEEPQEGENDGENIGKHHFSTYRPSKLYRTRNPEETALYERRFDEFLRNTIYEYMGVFHDKLIEEAVTGKYHHINPQSLKMMDGTPFLTQQEVPNILQFRRDLNQAQFDYQSYVYGNQYIKSSGIDIKSIFSNFKEFETGALTHLADVGLVESSKKVSGDQEQIKEKVKILNNQIARFGEEYKQEVLEDENYLVKVRKLEHLLPLDRVAHLESVAQMFDEQLTVQQAKIFEKNYKYMKESGKIPDAVKQTFGIDSNISVNELMTTMGLTYGIDRKDLIMLQRIKNYSKEEIKEDIKKQQKMERFRRRKRKVGSYDYVKDPSEIYVKDREGYFKVSRYRQI